MVNNISNLIQHSHNLANIKNSNLANTTNTNTSGLLNGNPSQMINASQYDTTGGAMNASMGRDLSMIQMSVNNKADRKLGTSKEPVINNRNMYNANLH
jgi:hypothetical protein